MNKRKIAIIYPKGTLHCNTLLEIVSLHLLEHLIYFDLKKKLGIHLLDRNSLIGGISSGYLGFGLEYFKRKDLNFLKEYFSNLLGNLKKIKYKTFLIEKRRIIEEEKFYTYDWYRELERLIFSKILNKEILNYKIEDYINISKNLSFKYVLDFAKKFFDENKFLIIASSGEKIKIVKNTDKNFILEDDIVNFKKDKLIIKTKKSLSYFIYLYTVDISFEHIFLYDLLLRQNIVEEFITKNIVFGKGLAYSYLFSKTFYFLQTLRDFLIIPTTKPSKVKQEFKNFSKKEIYQKIAQKFENLKKEELKKAKTDFFRKFKPAIIKYCLINKKPPNKKEILKKLSKLKIENFRNFLFNDLKTTAIEIRSK